MAQVQVDYTKQLDEIVHILSKPTTPAWATALVSLIVGVVGALIGLWLNDFYKRYKLRRVLYSELIEMFSSLEAIMEVPYETNVDPWPWRIKQIEETLKFDGQKYLNANQELYVSLGEHYAAEAMYGHFRSIIDDAPSRVVNIHFARTEFARAVKQGLLKKRWVRRFCTRRGYKRLMERVEVHCQPESAQPSAD